MSRLAHVMVATDLSAPARHAAERAALVAGNTASLSLVHVANLALADKLRQTLGLAPDGIERAMADKAAADLDALAEGLRHRFGLAAQTAMLTGDLLPRLSAQAAALPADLMVFGARGSSFMRHILLGSTAERLLSSFALPMLVVKQAAHEPYRRLLVAMDFSAPARRALDFARILAPTAEIVLLHTFEVPFEGQLNYAGVDDARIELYRTIARRQATEKLQALCAETALAPASSRLLILPGDPSQNIVTQEQESDCDLIVMGKHGESRLADFLLGSSTRHVLAEAQGDVLVCP